MSLKSWCTIQLAMHMECENTSQHCKSTFPVLKGIRRDDKVCTETFSLVSKLHKDVHAVIWALAKKYFTHAEPMKSESCSYFALKDFISLHGMPKAVKSGNDRSETGQKWTEHCWKYQIVKNTTEHHDPWRNYAEHKVRDLSTIVLRTMRKYNMTLIRYHWEQA